ncbi:MAG: 50S ribosomal protein L6 [Nanoarchaeota archaeon]|nr:50S ribosomal protein L6 [Nanoarchaeota archaeon]
MKIEKLEGTIEIPEGVSVKIEDGMVIVSGKNGEIRKKLQYKKASIEVKDSKVLISAKNAKKREKRIVGSFKAHIKNMIKGIENLHFYKLKVCSGHFPMNVSVEANKFVIKNFLGEKIPRVLDLKEGVSVKVEGDIVTVESNDKELAAQTAADIEQLTRISKKDLRIFQDGIYIIDKDGKEID